MGKPPTYMGTIDPLSAADAEVVLGIREAVRHLNRKISTRGIRYRVVLAPSGVKKQFRWKYENKHRPRVRFEDAESADVLVTRVHSGTKPRSRAGSRAR